MKEGKEVTAMTAPLANDDLPQAIHTYYQRSASTHPGTAIDAFEATAFVEDEGKTHQGRAAIAAWLERAASEYEYTRTFVRADRDGTEVTVINRLEGNFPGGTVDLAYRFVLAGERISELVIRPVGTP
jgi:hypothetical protein